MPIFVCPTCRAGVTVPESDRGRKIVCPVCNQRLQAPAAPRRPTTAPPRNQTVLAREQDVSEPRGSPGEEEDAPLEEIPRRRRRREEEVEDDRPRPRRQGDFRCPFCGTDRRPLPREKVAVGGWVLFGVLTGLGVVLMILGLITCITFFIGLVVAPLGVLGILIKEPYRVCAGCGTRLP